MKTYLWSIHRRSSRISRLRRSIANHVRVVRCLLLELLLLHLQLLRMLLRGSCCCWLLLYSDCRCCLFCCGLALLSLDDVGVNCALVSLCHFHEGEDDDGDSCVVDNIADGNPVLVATKMQQNATQNMFIRNCINLYLSSVPITCKDDPEVLDVAEEDDDEPGEEEARALSLRPEDEEEGASHGEEEVEANLVKIHINSNKFASARSYVKNQNRTLWIGC